MSARAAPAPQAAMGTGALPRHVAIIMDGNGRWAKARFLPRLAGHKAGVEAVRRITRHARKLGVEALTLYAFSSENWRRPDEEVSDLTGLLKHFIRADLNELVRENVRLRVIGDYRRFGAEASTLIEEALARTAGNSGPLLVIALNYGSHVELAHAAQVLAARVAQGTLTCEAITPEAIEAELETRDLPPLDLLIRTSGECRLSNFLLWQAAYAELLFVDTLWPDFDEAAFEAAIAQFGQRQRRFGGL